MDKPRVTDLAVLKAKETFMGPNGWERKDLEDHARAAVKGASDDDLLRFLLEQGYIEVR